MWPSGWLESKQRCEYQSENLVRGHLLLADCPNTADWKIEDPESHEDFEHWYCHKHAVKLHPELREDAPIP